AGGGRVAGGEAGRAEREAVPAGGALERDQYAGYGLRPEPRAGSVSQKYVHVLETDHRATQDDELRRGQPRGLRGAGEPDQYAAAGAEPHERRHVFGGGAVHRAADAEGSGSRSGGAAAARVPAGAGADVVGGGRTGPAG